MSLMIPSLENAKIFYTFLKVVNAQEIYFLNDYFSGKSVVDDILVRKCENFYTFLKLVNANISYRPYRVPYICYVRYVHNQTPHGQVHRMHRRTDNIQPHTAIRRGMHADK